MKSDIKDYLLKRDIKIEDRDFSKKVKDNIELMAKISGAWGANSEAIKTVLQSRCDTIKKRLLYEAVPEEVLTLREVLAELAGILEDFEEVDELFKNYTKEKIEEPKEGEIKNINL